MSDAGDVTTAIDNLVWWVENRPWKVSHIEAVRALVAEVERLRAALATARREAWEEGATAAREEDFLAKDFIPTPNPYA